VCAAEELDSRDLVAGRGGKPRGEVLLAGPSGPVEPDLREELEGSVGPDARKLDQIDASAQREQRGADLEGWLIGAAVLGAAGLLQERAGGPAGGLQGADAAFDLLIAAADLLLVEVVELKRLAEHEGVLGATVTGQGSGDLLVGGSCVQELPGRGER